MKTYKEYVEKGFLGFPERYLKNGDEIDIELAAALIDRTDMDVADLETWNAGLLQNPHPADIVGDAGIFDTVCRRNWLKPFVYKGQCFAGREGNRNPQMSRYIYVCGPAESESTEKCSIETRIEECCDIILDEGDIPIVAPYVYLEGKLSNVAFMKELDLEFLKKADGMFVLLEHGQISEEMLRKIRYAANHLGIPIEVIGCLRGRKER